MGVAPCEGLQLRRVCLAACSPGLRQLKEVDRNLNPVLASVRVRPSAHEPQGKLTHYVQHSAYGLRGGCAELA